MTGPHLDCTVLGPLTVAIDDVERPLGGTKQRAVLALLIINRNHALSVESLADAVWEGNTPPDVRASIHVVISNLRRLLRDGGIDPFAVLARGAPGYRLTLAETDCDLGRFLTDKAAGFAAAANHRFDQARTHFAAALRQWSGPALSDLRELQFAESFATALDEDRLSVITARAEVEIASGHPQTVITELLTLTAEHPLHEPLWAQLICALYQCGRQSDALAACRQIRATLADTLGIDPSPALQDLERTILRQEPITREAAASATAERALTVLDTQPRTHTARLRDAEGHIYTVTAAGITIGRQPDNDIVLDEAKVSRRHALIVNTGVSFVIKDLHSSNGTHLQGRRVIDRAELTDGDILRIGPAEFTFETGPP